MPTESDDAARFTTVLVSAFRIDDEVDFDIYFRPDPDSAPVLFQGKGLPLSWNILQNLKESGHTELLVENEFAEQFQRHSESRIASILDDETVAVEEKSKVLYETTMGMMQHVMNDPLAPDIIARSKPLVRSTVDFIANERHAFEHLLGFAAADYSTYRHSVDTCMFGIAFAQHAGIGTESEMREFGEGLLLHDIGMGMINPAILRNKNKLSQENFNLIREHPSHGYRILVDAGGAGEMALDVVLHHHERWNGQGYPDGLRSSDISPFVQVCTIVDVFAALIAGRPYRPSMTTFEALKLMKTDLSDHFNPEVLDMFIHTICRTGS